ncbi:MAG: tetratricopeptide repeat protein [Nitrospirae bacterium]|nr:tetratricopeptide repeat protein [Nitrospirota bacterium]
MNSILSKKNKLAALFFVSVTTFIVYLPALKNGFVNWDDYSYIVQNRKITSMGIDFFQWAFFNFHMSNWHPLIWISYAVDYALWGLNPMGYHLVNIILHSINSLLVTLLSFQLLEYYRRMKLISAPGFPVLSDEGIFIAGLVSGLLFGLHPIHVESVAWVSERKDVLYSFFFLLSLMSYMRYAYNARQETGMQNKIWLTDRHYLWTIGLFFLSILSKPMAITLPVVLCILDWYPFERFNKGSIKRVLLEKAPFFLIAFDLSITTILAQSYNFAMKSTADFPLEARVLVGFKSLIDYILNVLWPFSLSPLYPFPDNVSFISVQYTAGFIAVIFFTTVLLLKKNKLWLSVWFYYFLTLLPVLGFVKVGISAMADRYMYLPSLSFFFAAGLLLAVGIDKICFKYPAKKTLIIAGLFVCVIFVFVLFSFLTIKQVAVWKDSVVLWEYTTKMLRERGEQYYKKSFDAYNGLAMAYADTGRSEDAINELKINAYRTSPDSIHLYNSLGIIYQKTGRYGEAIESFKAALKIYPFNNTIINNLSIAYINDKQPEKAIIELNNSLKINPVFYLTHHSLGLAYMAQGRISEAVEKFWITLKLKPEYAPALDNFVEALIKRGLSYESDKQFDNAKKAFNDAMAADPNNKKLSEYEVKKHLEALDNILVGKSPK